MNQLSAALLAVALLAAPAQAAVRIKDLGHFEGVRPNQLIGYGLVVGLDGTGDSERASFTPQSLEAMLSRLGVRVDKRQFLLRNVAAVSVTAELPAFASPGTVIDVDVSSIGDARSIAGGTLLMTPLMGGNGVTYAVAQGPVQVGSGEGQGAAGWPPRGRGRSNAGRVPAGALVEKDIAVTLGRDGALRFSLARPDFKTAASLADAIERTLPPLLGGAVPPAGTPLAAARDAGVVQIAVPAGWETKLASLIALVEQVEVEPDDLARVVVSSTTGAVVLSGNVRLSKAAIAYDGVSVQIGEAPVAGPGGAPAGGQPGPVLRVVNDAATLADVVRGLNTLGVGPRGLADILEALSAAGALHATIEVRP